MTKVLDIFMFTHEFDLLELRMRTLWPVVDTFFMMEGDHNFANKPKEMRFEEQKQRFEWASDKLVYVQHRGRYKDGVGELFVEHQHRQNLYEYAKNMKGFEPDDIILMSDVDEIPSREIVEALKNDPYFPQPLLLMQDLYYYSIKGHRGKRWMGTIASRFGYDLGDIGTLRGNRNQLKYVDAKCGWHLAHFYDAKGIAEKLKHSSHQHYNCAPYNNPDYLKDCIKINRNYLGKEDGNLPQEPLPDYLLKEMSNFPFMLGDECQ